MYVNVAVIENSTQKTLSVIVRAGTSGGVEVSGPKRIPTVLRPQETFVEIPVDMKSSLAGKLTVEVVAGSAVIARQTIDVRGSYLDRIAIVGGIIFVLAVILALIVVRVRRSPDEPYTETATDADADSARYTEPSRARRRGERT